MGRPGVGEPNLAFGLTQSGDEILGRSENWARAYFLEMRAGRGAGSARLGVGQAWFLLADSCCRDRIDDSETPSSGRRDPYAPMHETHPVSKEESPTAVEFVTTQWTAVFSAADPANTSAREHLAKLYWYPLYAFARWKGLAAADAEDVVQTFLARLLNGEALGRLAREGGRFRDFLRTGIGNEIISQHRRATNSLRRPAEGFVFSDGLSAEARLALEPADPRSPERAFDRLCARALLDATARRVEQEYAGEREGLFAHLLAHLEGDPEAEMHREAARRFGLSEGSLRNKMTGFRARFRDCFRRQVALTLDAADGEAVDREITWLLAALLE